MTHRDEVENENQNNPVNEDENQGDESNSKPVVVKPFLKRKTKAVVVDKNY